MQFSEVHGKRRVGRPCAGRRMASSPADEGLSREHRVSIGDTAADLCLIRPVSPMETQQTQLDSPPVPAHIHSLSLNSRETAARIFHPSVSHTPRSLRDVRMTAVCRTENGDLWWPERLVQLNCVSIGDTKKPDWVGLRGLAQALAQSLSANSWAITARIFSSFSDVSTPALILTVKPLESLVIDPA